jgi:3-oxoacyl-[acyl-carrier-protein] synthase II
MDHTSSESVVITGIGLISPDAMSVQELGGIAQAPMTGYVASRNGDEVRPLTRFDPRHYLGERGFKYLTPATRYVLSAARLALEDAGLESDAYAPEDKGVILGTNFAIHDVVAAMDRVVLSEGAEALRPMEAPNFSINLPASYISIKHQFRAFNITLTSMLVAGLEAVMLGAGYIQKGRARLVLAGATEGTPPRRLARLLGGSVAEGAACVVSLETLSAAQARGAHIYACIGDAVLWFVPPRMAEHPEDRAQVGVIFRRHLDQMLLEISDVLRNIGCLICLIEADSLLGQLANEYVRQYLEEHSLPVKYQPCVKHSTTEACVSPLLHLAATASVPGAGLIVAISPLGHVAMLRLDSPISFRLRREY